MNLDLPAPESILLNFILYLFRHTLPETVYTLSICDTLWYLIFLFLFIFFYAHCTKLNHLTTHKGTEPTL